MKRISGASAPYQQANAARVVSEDETSCINKRLFTSFVARVPSNYLKKHPHYRAIKRRAALRKAEKAKAEATKAGFLPIPRSMMGSGWFHFVTTILGLGLF